MAVQQTPAGEHLYCLNLIESELRWIKASPETEINLEKSLWLVRKLRVAILERQPLDFHAMRDEMAEMEKKQNEKS